MFVVAWAPDASIGEPRRASAAGASLTAAEHGSPDECCRDAKSHRFPKFAADSLVHQLKEPPIPTMPQIAAVGYMTWTVGAPVGAMREQRLRGGGGRTALVEAAPRGCMSCDDDEVDLDVELLGCVLPPMPRRDLSTMRSEASATLGSSMQPAPTTCKPPLAKPPLSSASPFIAPHRPAQAYLSSCASSARAYL